MTAVTQPLRDEHKELLPQMASLRRAADSIGDAPFETVRLNLDEAYEFLAHHLIPHAQAEEKALYPVVERVMGAPEATGTMRRDHVEVGRLTAELGKLRGSLTGSAADGSEANRLRAVLYGLSTLVKVHFAKEEEVYLPILDQRLSQAEATKMFEAMEAAAADAKAASTAT